MRHEHRDVLLDAGHPSKQGRDRPSEEGCDHEDRSGSEGQHPCHNRECGLTVAVEDCAGYDAGQARGVGERLRQRRGPAQILWAGNALHSTHPRRFGRSVPALLGGG